MTNNEQISKLCPSCYSNEVYIFYKVQNVPVNSGLLLESREEALKFPAADIILGFCQSCGFIYNAAFDPNLVRYSTKYEATQSYSSTFNSFHRELAERLVERYDLYNKEIIEIGCGQGEFLKLLCDIGNNQGVGFDPVYDKKRSVNTDNENLKFIKDFYSEKYSQIHADFVCCKMTLEHIPDTGNFLEMIAKAFREKPGTFVFFQVPDTTRIWRELAFWDIYYEHCSYFCEESLSRLFRESGFDIIDLEKGYDDQYLMITAKPRIELNYISNKEDRLKTLRQDVNFFTSGYEQKLIEWKNKIVNINKAGKRCVIWGASSKGVAFLTTLKMDNVIQYAVDINPYKQNTYIAGTGQKIVGPEFLLNYKPDYVIVMNPIYNKEIRALLDNLGLSTTLLVA